MTDPTNFTHPLSGHEVVEDVLAQIRKRLHTDCSLRREDGYTGGYSGEVIVRLRCHAVRTSEIDMTIPITADPKLPGPDAFAPEDVESVEVDEMISIPLEPNLKEVRERTAQNNAEPIQDAEENAPQEQAPSVMTQRRKYAQAAIAGAGVGAVSGE